MLCESFNKYLLSSNELRATLFSRIVYTSCLKLLILLYSANVRSFLFQARLVQFVFQLCFWEMLLNSFRRVLNRVICQQNRIHFRSESHKFYNRNAARFVFEKSQLLFVPIRIAFVVFRIVRSVKVEFHVIFNFFVNVLAENLVT